MPDKPMTSIKTLNITPKPLTSIASIDEKVNELIRRLDEAYNSLRADLADATYKDLLVTGDLAVEGSATIAEGLTVDTTTLVVKPDTDRVGIGTESPNAPLEVKGAKPAGNVGGFQSGMFHVTGLGTAQFSNSVITGHNAYNTNTQLWYLGSMTSSNNDIAFINRQNAAMHFRTNNAFRMIIDASGNVGIGTASPTLPLDVNAKSGMTAIGGYAVKLTNKSGAASVAGDIVEASGTTADAVDVSDANCLHPVGAFYESGVPDGDEAWVVMAGIADIHMDAGGCALHDRIITSATPGRGDVSNSPAAAVHFQEIGHAIEVAGANENARCIVHFL